MLAGILYSQSDERGSDPRSSLRDDAASPPLPLAKEELATPQPQSRQEGWIMRPKTTRITKYQSVEQGSDPRFHVSRPRILAVRR
jgi:hypothetical protein